MPKAWVAFALAILFLTAAPFSRNALAFDGTGPSRLLCEGMQEPLGIDISHPRLSWQLQDSRRGARQTAYEVRVASSARRLAQDHADVWDSGRVDSDQSVNVLTVALRSSLAGATTGRCEFGTRRDRLLLTAAELVGDGIALSAGLESEMDHSRYASGAGRL